MCAHVVCHLVSDTTAGFIKVVQSSRHSLSSRTECHPGALFPELLQQDTQQYRSRMKFLWELKNKMFSASMVIKTKHTLLYIITRVNSISKDHFIEILIFFKFVAFNSKYVEKIFYKTFFKELIVTDPATCCSTVEEEALELMNVVFLQAVRIWFIIYLKTLWLKTYT